MTVTEKIQEILIADATLIALVPAARIRCPGNWQNLDLPYIVHFPVSITPLYTHEGLEAHREWRYQIDVFSSTFSSGDAIATAVRNAVTGVHALSSPPTEGVTIFWNSGLWYVGGDEDDQFPRVEHFIVETTVHERL